MLAFSLPFTAQVTQWIVTTYGVATFPEIIKDELKINTLLSKMFIFVGLVIFWRIFIYDISPYTSSLYILFNLIIAISFIWILCRLFKVIGNPLKINPCTCMCRKTPFLNSHLIYRLYYNDLIFE